MWTLLKSSQKRELEMVKAFNMQQEGILQLQWRSCSKLQGIGGKTKHCQEATMKELTLWDESDLILDCTRLKQIVKMKAQEES